MGIYYVWANHTKRLHYEPPNVKCPCSAEALSVLAELADGEWKGDDIRLHLDSWGGYKHKGEEDENPYWWDWPTIEREPAEIVFPAALSHDIPRDAWEINPFTRDKVYSIAWMTARASPR